MAVGLAIICVEVSSGRYPGLAKPGRTEWLGRRGMTQFRWTWVGTRSTWTSHLRSGKGCDDFGACVELSSAGGQVLIAVASDGAGSARHSSIGSWVTVRAFVENAVRFLNGHV